MDDILWPKLPHTYPLEERPCHRRRIDRVIVDGNVGAVLQYRYVDILVINTPAFNDAAEMRINTEKHLPSIQFGVAEYTSEEVTDATHLF